MIQDPIKNFDKTNFAQKLAKRGLQNFPSFTYNV